MWRGAVFALAWIGCVTALPSPLTPPAAGQSPDFNPAKRINRANELLRNGQLDEAIEVYQSVPQDAIGAAEARYNLGVALYQKGDLAQARKVFTGIATADDDQLAARARYNLANCHYASALQVADKNPQQAIEKLRQAIRHYRSSLRIDPNQEDARANIELAAKLIQQLTEQQEKQQNQSGDRQDQPPQRQPPQRKGQSTKQDPPPNGDQSPQEEQPPQNDESPKGDQPPPGNQTPSQGERSPNKQQPRSEEQPPNDQSSPKGQSTEPNDASGEENREAGQPPQGGGERPQPSQSPGEGTDEQSESSKQLPGSTTSNEPTQREKDQVPPRRPTPPTGNNDTAEGELTAQPSSEAAETTPDRGANATESEKAMTLDEALKLLQAVRDREMLRHLRRRQRADRIPVEKDW